jgi:parallel beta-helix repeat protein
MGLWTDIDNSDTLYEYNRSEDNDHGGIFHEISYAATIRYNTCLRNGVVSPFPGWVDGAGIIVSSSSDVEVYGNTVTDNFQGIMALDSARVGSAGRYYLRNLSVHDNTVTMKVGRTGIMQNAGDDEAFLSRNNRFARNRYVVGTNARYFTWLNSDRTQSEWVSFGQDSTDGVAP